MEQKNHRLLMRALTILEYIAKKPEGVSFKEICDISGLPKSSTHNLVQTLCNMNYLQKKGNYNEYQIGLKAFEVGSSYLSTNPFFSAAKGIVENISKECRQTAHLGILVGTDVLYLYKFDSNQSLRIASEIGKRMPAHATAIGKALLAGLSDEELQNLYSGYAFNHITKNTIVSFSVLLEQIENIRKTQFATEKEESSPFIQCIAVPILNRQKKTIAAISVSYPVYQKEADEEMYTNVLLEGKHLLENLLFSLNI